MTHRFRYTYSVLRYVHDTTTGEFVNVGVALHSADARYASAMCRTTYKRLSQVFPGLNAAHFRGLMRYVQGRFEELGDRLQTELPFDAPLGVMELARSILPTDDGSLQWSPEGVGFSDDPSATLEALFKRMVLRYEESYERPQRTEEDVWREFRPRLESRRLLHHFAPKRLTVDDDEVEFQHTWKNGILHCLEPVAFDLVQADSIRDKAHKWLGRLTSIARSLERFRMYFLVGAPREQRLLPAFDSAVRILQKSAVETRIYREAQVEELSETIAHEVEEHNRAN